MIEIILDANSWCCIESIMLLPMASTLENVAENGPESRVLPTLNRTIVNVRAKSEFSISRLTNPHTIIVGNRNVKFDLIWYGCMP